jgi:putative ABC transport system permease protein
VTGSSPISAATVQKVAAVHGVAVAVPITFGEGISIVGRGEDGAVTLTTGTAAGTARSLGSALPKGSPIATVRADTVYLPETPFPPFYPNDTVTLEGPGGHVADLSIQYVAGLQLPSLVTPSVLAKVSTQEPTLEVWVGLKNDANRAEVLEDLTGIAIQSGELPIGGPTVLDVRTASAFSTARAAALAILAIAVLVAVIGAAATAALSIAERSREHATLRSLGLERAKVSRMLATRVVFVGAVAGLLGVAAGALLGLVAARLVTASLSLAPRISLPMLPVLVVVVLTVVAVRIAALLPIEKASYIPPSRALAKA